MSRQAPHIFGVELTCDEYEYAIRARHPRLWRNQLRHVRSGRLLKQVTHFHPFGLEISGVVRIRFAPNRHLFDHLNAVALKSYHFLRIICEEANLATPEIVEN